jgi:hypothetical protein
MGAIVQLLMPLATRLINMHTPKGILQVLLGLILMSMGASDDIVKWAMEQNLNPIAKMLFNIWNVVISHSIVTSIVSIILISLGGFYIWRRDTGIVEIEKLENEIKILELNNRITELKSIAKNNE